jgi:hypothetical protein
VSAGRPLGTAVRRKHVATAGHAVRRKHVTTPRKGGVVGMYRHGRHEQREAPAGNRGSQGHAHLEEDRSGGCRRKL